MDEKLKFKTHIQITFFDLLSRFCAFCFKVLKSVNITFKQKIRNGLKKTQNFTLILNPVKKYLKNAHKKVISKTSLRNMSKSVKWNFF